MWTERYEVVWRWLWSSLGKAFFFVMSNNLFKLEVFSNVSPKIFWLTSTTKKRWHQIQPEISSLHVFFQSFSTTAQISESWSLEGLLYIKMFVIF